MGQTLENLTEIVDSTRKQIISLQATEGQLIATKRFIMECGAKEDTLIDSIDLS